MIRLEDMKLVECNEETNLPFRDCTAEVNLAVKLKQVSWDWGFPPKLDFVLSSHVLEVKTVKVIVQTNLINREFI